ncbi:hypothetical protein [Pontibacter vulgaris]|uniref:hypothetical protein n=1 Tax=Pontibacter vulgaris TaxID=2905679 RepID=UPI001FA6C851|nr:hypothetical protein [Pontibacter vulgaris]
MKYKLLLSILTLVYLASCNHQTEKPEATQKATITATDISGCYAYFSPQDTVLFHLNVQGKTFTGELVYNYFQKDKNTGTIKGKIHGDTLLADYTFMSEGIESVREVLFLKQGNTLVEGYGEVTEQAGKMVFPNKRNLDFSKSKPLIKTNCEEDIKG